MKLDLTTISRQLHMESNLMVPYASEKTIHSTKKRIQISCTKIKSSWNQPIPLQPRQLHFFRKPEVLELQLQIGIGILDNVGDINDGGILESKLLKRHRQWRYYFVPVVDFSEAARCEDGVQ